MESRISRIAWRILFTSALVSVFAAGLLGQRKATQRGEDEDFNSPTPILLSEADTTRALAQPASEDGSAVSFPSKGESFAFEPGSKAVLYVTNLALLEGEGANAFRVYATDSRGHTYRFPVLDLQPSEQKGVFALTTLLTDEIGYFEPPVADGDILIYVTWRGLASNETKLGLGKVGGDIKEKANSKPTPYGTTADQLAPQLVGPLRQGDRIRFLEQATFGPTRDFATQFNRTKLRYWINNQFNATYPSAGNPYPNQPLKPFFAPADCDNDQVTTPDVPVTCYRDTYFMYPIQTWNSLEMLYGTNQLRHKVSWALSQIWVTSGNTIQQSRHMVEWHKILSNNAFGNYKDIMKQMTLHPTMGQYLSMAGSTRTAPNENYAREIEQLFSIGLFMMNQDGTYQCVEHNPCLPGDTKIPTYDQNQINNLTRVFTGWNLCTVAGASCPNHVTGANNHIDPMILNRGVTTGANNRHDLGAKTLLVYPGSTTTNVAACPLTGAGACGLNCPPTGSCVLQAGFTNATALAAVQTYANASLDQAIDNIFNHPNVGPFVSRILIQQLVTSDPTPAYVGRVAAVFNNNGAGVRGDMKSVIAAILLDREARGDVKTDPNYGKLREPVSYMYGALRALNVRNAAGTGPSDGVFISVYTNFSLGNYTGMGQNPFNSPTVFNYYPPSYVVPGTSINGPEFALLTTGTAIQRASFANRLVGFNTGGTIPNPVLPLVAANVTTDVPVGTSIDIADLQALFAADNTGGTLVDELDKRFMHYTMSSTMRTSILNSLAPIANTNTSAKVRQALYLVLSSSQYQVQR